MQKLGQGIQIKLGDEVLLMRPSLRHALALESLSAGGLPGLLSGLSEGSLTVYCAIIRPHYHGPDIGFASRVFDAMNDLQEPLSEYVIACLGIDPDRKADTDYSEGKAVPFREHLISLYKIGTGWLGWTADQTLDSTAYEIRLAYEGRIDLLKAIFGSPESKPETDGMSLDDKLKSAFGMFKTTKAPPRHKRRKAAA
jgi:hypothetical protein